MNERREPGDRAPAFLLFRIPPADCGLATGEMIRGAAIHCDTPRPEERRECRRASHAGRHFRSRRRI